MVTSVLSLRASMDTNKFSVARTIAAVCLIITAVTQVHAQEQSVELIRITDTFSWNPPSPDPTGVVYVPGADSLFVVDSEVNETVLFNGSNLFQSALDGTVLDFFNTLEFTSEPTGIAVNPANAHLFITSDNSPRRVFEIDPGNDGIYRNMDDTITSFSTTDFGSFDAEGITYNPTDGRLYIAGGISNLIYIVDPGSNQLFDGMPPVGDDVITSFDTGSLGIIDAEGIAYDSLTDALYVVGKPKNQLLHVSTNGDLMRLLSLDVPFLVKPAGLAIAPSSLDNGADSLYMVDRGVDNDHDPTENDGRIYEFALPPVTGNMMPTVTIVAPIENQSFQIGADITFTGTALDPEDGDISASLLWESDQDGLFGSGAQFTTSSLSPGLHTITASSVDSSLTQGVESITLRIISDGTLVIQKRIDSSSDDAEQRGVSGNTWLTGNDLELITDNSVEQIVGLRFNDLQIPTFATIEEAYIQFRADETQSDAVTLEIRVQASDDAEPLLSIKRNLTERATTNVVSIWQPAAWTTVGESGLAQKTSDLSSLVQEVVNRSGWNPSNSMAFLISGSGTAKRTAESFDSEPDGAPLLYVRYTETPSAPMIVINSPANGQSFANGVPVSFNASANDSQDGDLSASISWESDLNGTLGSGASVTVPNFSVGTHLITATVLDSSGLSSSEFISIVIGAAGNTAPSLTITSPADGSLFAAQTLVSLSATATDEEDGNLSNSVSWASDLDGALGAGAIAIELSEGVHTISASVSDSGGLTVSSAITVQIEGPTASEVTLAVRISAGSDDAEERESTGGVALTSSDLELAIDRSKIQLIGLRFNNLQIPKDAGIVSASIQFQVDESSDELAFLDIAIQESDNTSTFSNSALDISLRPRSVNSISWLPSPWDSAGSAGPDQQTPDLSSLVQHIVNRDNWSTGNSMVFLIDGDGTRTAEAYEGNASAAALLTITYTETNSAPTVETSADVTLAGISDPAFISATVSDDGNPADPGSLSYQWTVAGGSGSVMFGDSASLSTAVSFDSVGTYTLILSVSDGQLSAYDSLTVTVTPSAQNLPPVVSAGPDLQTSAGGTVSMAGTVSDDGLPGGAIELQINWTQVSGPATAVINSTSSASTTADIPSAGNYVFELSAYDGELLSTDQVAVSALDAAGNGSIDIQITEGSDDAEESASGAIDLFSSDLELIFDKSNQIVGLRFTGASIPENSTITNAYIQFTADEIDTGSSNLIIQAEAVDNAALFTSADGSLSSRPLTLSSIAWVPPAWESKGESGLAQKTPDLATLIQEIVDRPGWINGNALSIIISGNGTRTAESYEGVPDSAARLIVDYQINE